MKEWHLQIGNFRIWEDESEVTLPARRKGETKKKTTILKINYSRYISLHISKSQNHFHLEALRGVGGIILNAEGKRFCNELGRPGLSAIEAGQK